MIWAMPSGRYSSTMPGTTTVAGSATTSAGTERIIIPAPVIPCRLAADSTTAKT